MEHLQDQEVTLPELYFSIIDVFVFFYEKIKNLFSDPVNSLKSRKRTKQIIFYVLTILSISSVFYIRIAVIQNH